MSNNNINNSKFTNKENIKILWEVLLSELNMQQDKTTLTSNIRSVFESNINPFTARINPKSSLMDLNKLFLSQVVIAVNRLFPNLKQRQQIQTIKISNEPLDTPFEDLLKEKVEEFENFSTFKKPKELDFSDKKSDEKITEMQALIAETMAKRNFEVEQFQILNNSNLSSESETWLQSTNTSVKTDKQNALKETTNNVEQRKLKYNTFFDKETNNSKKVTWSSEAPSSEAPSSNIEAQKPSSNIEAHNNLNISLSIEDLDVNFVEENSNNILSKLKKLPVKNVNVSNENTFEKLSSQIEELNSKFDILLNLLINKI
jgi:hypothetical protein